MCSEVCPVCGCVILWAGCFDCSEMGKASDQAELQGLETPCETCGGTGWFAVCDCRNEPRSRPDAQAS